MGRLGPDSSYVSLFRSLPLPVLLIGCISPENLRRSVDNVNKHLRGLKKLDLFEPARVDPNVPIEETVKTLGELIEEGKFDYIGLSECSAETLKRANAVRRFLGVHEMHLILVPWNERCTLSRR